MKQIILSVLFTLLASVMINGQVDRTYFDNVQTNLSSYCGMYTVAPFEVWQVEPSISVMQANGKISATCYQPSESCDDGAKTSVMELKNFRISGNKFYSDKYSGRFVWASIKCTDGNVLKIPGLLVDSVDGFYAKHVINVTSSSVLKETGKAADYYSPLNVLLEQYSVQSPCNVVYEGAEGSFAVGVPSRTNSDAYKGSGTWAEGVSGTGKGEWLQFDFIVPLKPVSVSFFNGHKKSEALYKMNGRVKSIKVTASDGTDFITNLADKFEMQDMVLNLKEAVNWIRVEIMDVYPGSKFEDTCVSRVSFGFESR